MRLLARVLPLLALLPVVALFVRPPRAHSLPLYAARTGLQCQTCHFDPNGGGPRNDFGFAFARNRHALTPDTTGEWKDLSIGNRVSDTVPIYFGLDQRFMLLSNARVSGNPAERAGFFNMENALYVTFQPHRRLALVYSRDAFADDPTSALVVAQDAFGLLSGLPLDGYVKVGRFRTPFGLRMDDHTVATRQGFLEFEKGLFSPAKFLPYDPRFPDMGVEIGGGHGGFFGRAAFTNGASNVLAQPPFGQPFAQTGTAKLGYNMPYYQGAVSLYDDYEKSTGLFPARRFTRWGYYGMTHFRQLSLLGEIDAGTDHRAPLVTDESRTNLLAGFAEANFTLNRTWNFRARYDRLELDRSPDLAQRPDGSLVAVSDLNTWDRYSIEGEIVPVPFAELRWSLRQIVPKADRDALGNTLRHERQAFLQFHLTY